MPDNFKPFPIPSMPFLLKTSNFEFQLNVFYHDFHKMIEFMTRLVFFGLIFGLIGSLVSVSLTILSSREEWGSFLFAFLRCVQFVNQFQKRCLQRNHLHSSALSALNLFFQFLNFIINFCLTLHYHTNYSQLIGTILCSQCSKHT